MTTFDLFDPQTQECPYEAYTSLRDDSPVYRVPDTNMYVVTRYADIVDISRRTAEFAQGPASGEALIKDEEALEIYRRDGIARPPRVPLSSDPPIHRHYRSMVDGFFSARGAERQRPLITKVTNSVIDTWIDKGEIEYVTEFAKPLPVHIITVMMGFPEEAIPDLVRWSDAWVMPFSGNLTPEQERYVAEQGVEWQRAILKTIEEKRRNPDKTVLSHLGNADFVDVDGTRRRLTDQELVYMVDQVHTGGNETTTFAMTSALWLMLTTPGVEERLRADRSLIPRFVDECLRLESPTQGMFRHTTREVELHGVTIPAGATVHLRFAAANRDERFFPDPSVINLGRRNGNRHVAFGQGEHHCVGAGLSRLEQQIALDVLLTRLDDLRLLDTNDYRHKPGFVLRALKELRVGFSKAATP
jgi:cytochrome P450